MDNNKNNSQQPNESAGEQNPTLNSPGSKVADYGNPTGGASNSQEVSGQSNEQDSNNERGGSNDTVGNP